MKICENGIYRDMTAEEIAELQAREMENTQAVEALTNWEKMELFLASIPTADTPSVEPKVGYKWQPIYTASSGFAWELVEDPNALGTMANPLVWLPGASVKMGYHYTHGGETYLALDDGTPTGIDDKNFFAKV